MRACGHSRILIVGCLVNSIFMPRGAPGEHESSVAGFMPSSFRAAYSGTKAFINYFAFALRNELQDTGMTVTYLMPGATETAFLARADMLNTALGQQEKDDPADVAKAGFDAMMQGESEVVSGWKNKLQATMAHVSPTGMLAERHRQITEPGAGKP